MRIQLKPIGIITSVGILILASRLKKTKNEEVVETPVEEKVLKTPSDWCLELDARILDADGWRDGSRDWYDPISRQEFDARLAFCTIDARGYPEFRVIPEIRKTEELCKGEIEIGDKFPYCELPLYDGHTECVYTGLSHMENIQFKVSWPRKVADYPIVAVQGL